MLTDYHRMPAVGQSRVTPAYRSHQYSKDLYKDGGTLRCKFCSHRAISLKESTIKNHINSKVHKEKKAISQRSSSSPALQISVPRAFGIQEERNVFIEDFVFMALSANIPLEEAPKIQSFLTKYSRKGGLLPAPNTLRDRYIPRVADKLRVKLNNLIISCKADGYYFTLNIDETCDERENYVLHLILRFREHSLLLDSKFLDTSANHRSLAASVNEAIVKFGLAENVSVFLTDNTAYCQKSYSDVLTHIYPDITWVGCWAHIVDLCGDCWQGNFQLANRFCSLMRNFFKKLAAGRRKRWAGFQRNNGLKPTFAPTANFTRWTAWIKATIYHSNKIDLYPDFFLQELEISDCAYIQELFDIVTTRFTEIKLHLSFLAEHGQKIIAAIEFFEISNKPIAHRVYNMITDFSAVLENGTTNVIYLKRTDALLNSCTFTNTEVAAVLELFMGGFRLAHRKFCKHIENQKTAVEMFKSIRIFDPTQRPTLPRDITQYSNLKGFSSAGTQLLDEWAIYWGINEIFDMNSFDIVSFWISRGESMPILSKLALNYIWVPASAATVERSFSKLKQLESPQRLAMSDATLRDSIFCLCNSQFMEIE